mmetsp:Transcript_14643/g.28168  ORF Transcript_14643/g.28168 Transcript_14643/m.28168 type:complete len:149 (+) Transcript_14643:890-1336(+)
MTDRWDIQEDPIQLQTGSYKGDVETVREWELETCQDDDGASELHAGHYQNSACETDLKVGTGVRVNTEEPARWAQDELQLLPFSTMGVIGKCRVGFGYTATVATAAACPTSLLPACFRSKAYWRRDECGGGAHYSQAAQASHTPMMRG